MSNAFTPKTLALKCSVCGITYLIPGMPLSERNTFPICFKCFSERVEKGKKQ